MRGSAGPEPSGSNGGRSTYAWTRPIGRSEPLVAVDRMCSPDDGSPSGISNAQLWMHANTKQKYNIASCRCRRPTSCAVCIERLLISPWFPVAHGNRTATDCALARNTNHSPHLALPRVSAGLNVFCSRRPDDRRQAMIRTERTQKKNMATTDARVSIHNTSHLGPMCRCKSKQTVAPRRPGGSKRNQDIISSQLSSRHVCCAHCTDDRLHTVRCLCRTAN